MPSTKLSWAFLVVFTAVCCLLLEGQTQAQENPPPTATQRLNIIGIDDSGYPNLHIFAAVIDAATASPITSLLPEDFMVTINEETSVPVAEIDTDTNVNRPQHTMIVLDLTSTVSEAEFMNMRAAAIEFINTLSIDDQVGIVGTYADRSTVLQPLSIDHNAAINAMFSADALPADGQDGNVVLDGLYIALESIQQTAPDVRPAVLMFTDVASGSLGGERTLEEVQMLAEQRTAEIYVAYFETENSEGLPIRDTPPEPLQEIAVQSGGLLLQQPGEQNPDDPSDYNDDNNLVALALQMADFLAFEYRLVVASPIPGDNEIYELQLGATLDDTVLGPERTFFRARTGIVDIAFSPFQSGARVTLPTDLQIRVLSASNPLTNIDIFRIDNTTGEEIPLASLASAEESLTLAPDVISTGVLSLVARATDEGGNTGEAFLTLVIENPNATPVPTATWTPMPTPTALPPTPTVPLVPTATASPTASAMLATSPTALPTTAIDTAPPPGTADEAEGDSNFLIPLVVALMGMVGTLLIGFSLLALAQRRSNSPDTPITPAASDTERPTIPRKSSLSTNAPTASISTSTLQPTVKLESKAPSKEIWQKAMENLDTQAVAAMATEETPRAVLLGADNQRHVLIEGENTIGRHSSNMVQILDPTVSRYHAVIEIFGDNISMMDWQASHPSTVNGAVIQIGERKALRTGDQIQMGNTVLRLVAQEW